MRDVRKIVRIVSCIMKRFLKLIIKKLYHWRIIIILLEIKITWRLWRKCWKSWERKIKINWKKKWWKRNIEKSKDHSKIMKDMVWKVNMKLTWIANNYLVNSLTCTINKAFSKRSIRECINPSRRYTPVCPSFLAESYQRIRPILDPIIVQWMKHLRLLTTLLSRYTVHH